MRTQLTCLLLFTPLLPGQKTATPELRGATTQRMSTSLWHWVPDRPSGPSKGQAAGRCVITYGQVAWNPRFERVATGLDFPRWRLGRDHWTTLDTDVDVKIGFTTIPAGHYFLALDRGPTVRKDSGTYPYQLVLLDSRQIRAQRLDASQVAETAGGIYVRMKTIKRKGTAEKLDIRLTPSAKAGDAAKLTIAFGPRSLVASAVLKTGEPAERIVDVGKVLSPDSKWILEHAKAIEIYALHPKPAKAGEAGGEKRFHGYRIHGQKSIADTESKDELIRLLYRGIQLGEEQSRFAAFDSNAWTTAPRHGIRAAIGHLAVDMVIDSSEGASAFYREDGSKAPGDTFSMRVVGSLTTFFRKRGLDPSKSQ